MEHKTNKEMKKEHVPIPSIEKNGKVTIYDTVVLVEVQEISEKLPPPPFPSTSTRI